MRAPTKDELELCVSRAELSLRVQCNQWKWHWGKVTFPLPVLALQQDAQARAFKP